MTLEQQWQHLATWWDANGHRYNMSALARHVGLSNAVVYHLLHPSPKRSGATAERLARIQAYLGQRYCPPAEEV